MNSAPQMPQAATRYPIRFGGTFSSPLRTETTAPSPSSQHQTARNNPTFSTTMPYHHRTSQRLDPRVIQSSPLKVPAFQTCLPMTWKPLVQTAEAPRMGTTAAPWNTNAWPTRTRELPEQRAPESSMWGPGSSSTQTRDDPGLAWAHSLDLGVAEKEFACGSQKEKVGPPSYDEIANPVRSSAEEEDDLEDSYVDPASWPEIELSDTVLEPAASQVSSLSLKTSWECNKSDARAPSNTHRYPFHQSTHSHEKNSSTAKQPPNSSRNASTLTSVSIPITKNRRDTTSESDFRVDAYHEHFSGKDDDDAAWTTLPSRKRAHVPAGTRKGAVKQSGRFKLPLSLARPSPPRQTTGTPGTNPRNEETVNPVQRRVVTYLPPPLQVQEAPTESRSGQSGARDDGDSILKWSIKRARPGAATCSQINDSNNDSNDPDIRKRQSKHVADSEDSALTQNLKVRRKEENTDCPLPPASSSVTDRARGESAGGIGGNGSGSLTNTWENEDEEGDVTIAFDAERVSETYARNRDMMLEVRVLAPEWYTRLIAQKIDLILCHVPTCDGLNEVAQSTKPRHLGFIANFLAVRGSPIGIILKVMVREPDDDKNGTF